MAKAAAQKPTTAKGKPPAKIPNTPQATKDELLDYYRQMVLIRRFEERAGQLYGMGLIGGFCHLYIGQEAVAVGVQASVKQGHDKIITGYRDHGHMLAAGMDPNEVMAELTGRIGGSSKGKGGSMHMFDVPTGFYGGHGIVGAQVALGTGLAFAGKYRAKEEVDEVKKTRDPIEHIKKLLADAKATEDEIKAIDADIKTIVAEAVQFAQESPEPDPSELYTDVYVEA